MEEPRRIISPTRATVGVGGGTIDFVVVVVFAVPPQPVLFFEPVSKRFARVKAGCVGLSAPFSDLKQRWAVHQGLQQRY